MTTERKSSLMSLNDFISGSVAGVVQVLLGQPLDMMKVRMQTNPAEYTNLVQTAKKILQSEGAMGFYKGTISPLCGISLCVAIQFSANEAAKNFFINNNYKKKSNADPNKLSVLQYIYSGIFAGFCNSFAMSPIELFRIKMQVQSKDSPIQYNGTVDCAKKILQNYGIKGVYQGLCSTLLRECPAYAIYFGTYETLMQTSLKKYKNKSEIPMLHIMTYGAISGVLLWLGTFPFDVIKSRIQADNIDNRKYKSIMQTFRHVVNENGIGGLYKGLPPCLVRAPFINAATFMTFEIVSKKLNKK